MENDIIMTGKVTDRKLLSYYYNRADIMLFPSIYDASSIVQIEASSQKTPTIFLENTATSATVTNNVNGFLAKNTIEDYTNKIIEVIENKKLYKEVAENAYRDLYKNWDDTVEEAYNLYQEMINKKKK